VVGLNVKVNMTRKQNTAVNIKPKGDNQKNYIHSLQTKKITFCEGPAGTGKTFLATIKGIEGILDDRYQKLVISRPLVQSGEDTGYLPGNINDKLDPYVRPIYDILEYSFTNSDLDKLKKEKRIEVVPFAYMRGRNFFNSFVILDEVQNCSYEQLLLALTRFARGSKMVLTGDSAQSDLPKEKRGGFNTLMGKLEGVADIGMVQLFNKDIVRESIVKDILEKLDEEKQKSSK
tara:strand:+ start:511 stop:1206 length:696 start_codon:yes stop_codon:yes gene_type:complete